MEDTLISFKTAKLAKEKGFKNIKCDYTYENKILVKGQEYYGSLNHYDNEYSAPTQSLLQKWLREVHSIHIIIHYDYSIIGGYIVIYIIKSIEPRFINQINKKSKYENYKTYEESLEKGLQEALKLIII